MFYYFKTLDDIFVAMIERNALAFHQRLADALQEQFPLQAIWALSSNRQSAPLELEIKAMSVHKPSIAKAFAENIELYRAQCIQAIGAHLDTSALPTEWHPTLALILESVERHFSLDVAIDIALIAAEAPDAAIAMEGEAYITRIVTASLSTAVMGHHFSEGGLTRALPLYGCSNPDYIMHSAGVDPTRPYRFRCISTALSGLPSGFIA